VTVFADSSAVVKLYADEPGSDHVRELADVVVSALARVEVPAALWRKCRTGELDVAAARTLVDEFEADYHGGAAAPRFAAIAVSSSILEEAARLTAGHGLRAYDAVQLASALAARAALPTLSVMAVFDRALSAAAAAEGLGALPYPASLTMTDRVRPDVELIVV
jgi:predicted nucleic acid-binding protein